MFNTELLRGRSKLLITSSRKASMSNYKMLSNNDLLEYLAN